MKITALKPYLVWATFRNQLIVKLETDEGYYGWGESGVSGRELAVRGAVEHYGKFLVGKDPRRIGALWQEMYRGQYFEGGRILTGAISAIDIALHDLVARKLEVPVYQLLGGAQRESIPCFPTAVNSLSGPAVVEEARTMVAEGWNIIRLSPGHPDNGGDRDCFQRLAAARVRGRALSSAAEATICSAC